MDLIHNMDVVDQLLAANVTAPTDWAWRKQLRFYLSDKGHVLIRMVTAQVLMFSIESRGVDSCPMKTALSPCV